MNMIYKLYRKIFPCMLISDIVLDDLHQAKIDLLYAHSQAEYYSSMVQMLKGRVARLEEAAK